eukprot:502168-Rhodomonas_salina.1
MSAAAAASSSAAASAAKAASSKHAAVEKQDNRERCRARDVKGEKKRGGAGNARERRKEMQTERARRCRC